MSLIEDQGEFTLRCAWGGCPEQAVERVQWAPGRRVWLCKGHAERARQQQAEAAAIQRRRSQEAKDYHEAHLRQILRHGKKELVPL